MKGMSSWLLASTSAFVIAIPAVAQTTTASTPADANSQSATSEIIVTAQFRSQRLQDTPLAITAVNADKLAARGQTSITDIGQFAPNVNLTQASALNSNSISAFIRGIGQDASSFALEPGVGIYVDDIYYGTTFGASLDFVDLDRVEVLRGPQGTLAGKNSLGGAVKLFTKKPDGNGGGSFEVGTGSFHRVDVRGSADFKLTDGLFARLSGTYDKRDGYFKRLDYGCANPGSGIAAQTTKDDCVIGRQGGTNNLSLRGALRYAPAGSPLEINVSGDYSNNKDQPVASKLLVANTALIAPASSLQSYRTYDAGNILGGVPWGSQFLTGSHSYTSYEDYSGSGNFTTIFGFPTQVAPGTFPDKPKNNARSWGVTGTIDYKFSPSLSLKSITGYRDVDGTNVLEIDGSPTSVLKERYHNKHRQFTQELRLNGKIGTLVDFTVGGFYYKAKDEALQRIMIPTFQYDFLGDDRSNNRSVAGFANIELHATSKLNFIGGIRYTDDRKSYSFGRTNADGSPISGIPFTMNWLVFGLDGLSDTFKGSRWDYRLGANYRFSPNLMVYGQVSTGYKGGGINPQPFVPDQVLPFKPETVTTFEGGFKAGTGRTFSLNGAYFYNDYKNIQRTFFICPFSTSQTCGLTGNGGNGHSQGVELEAMLRPTPALTIDGSVGYLDFKYDKVDPLTLVTLDMTAPYNSKWTASSGVQYRIDTEIGSITPRVDWTYQSSFYSQAVNNAFNKVPGRSLVNLHLTLESVDKRWQLAAGVTNLTNKYYYTTIIENTSNFGLSEGMVGRPREWSLSAKYKF